MAVRLRGRGELVPLRPEIAVRTGDALYYGLDLLEALQGDVAVADVVDKRGDEVEILVGDDEPGRDIERLAGWAEVVGTRGLGQHPDGFGEFVEQRVVVVEELAERVGADSVVGDERGVGRQRDLVHTRDDTRELR